MSSLIEIALQIRAEAAIADRPGQMARLETLATWLEEYAKGVETMTIEELILTLQSALEAALTREDTLVAWLVRFLDIAEPAENMAHLNETESLDLLTEEIKQALEPYQKVTA